MIRALIFSSAALATLTACTSSGPTNVVSSMNFLMEPISEACVQETLAATEGFVLTDTRPEGGNATRLNWQFDNQVPVSVIVRAFRDGTGEVSTFTRLLEGATPIDRQKARFVVRAADEAIYLSCTEDGRTYGDPSVVIETTE